MLDLKSKFYSHVHYHRINRIIKQHQNNIKFNVTETDQLN